MEYRIDFFSDGPQDVTITVSGAADSLGFRRGDEQLVAASQFRAGLIILVDASALDTSQLSGEELQAAIEPAAARDWRFPARAVAFLAPDPRTSKDMGLIRAHMGGSVSRRRVFESREAALEWLSKQRDTAH
jgi:hypothetical protein